MNGISRLNVPVTAIATISLIVSVLLAGPLSVSAAPKDVNTQGTSR